MNFKLQQAIALFMQNQEALNADKTVTYYRSCIKYFVEFITQRKDMPASDILLETISTSDLMEYVKYLRTKNKFEGNRFVDQEKHKDEMLSKVSINSYQRGIKIFFRYCYNEELMEHNIVSNYKLIKKEKKEKIPLYNSEVMEIESLYNAKTETGSRNLAIIHLMLDAGARLSEVLNLKICDVMFQKNLLLLDGKGDKQRLVPLGKKLKKLLFNYIVKYRKVSLSQQGDIMYTEDKVFMNVRTREPMQKTAITMMFRRIKTETGIKRVHPHLLRHTFATSYILCGGDIKSLQLYMGHEDIATTSAYLHIANMYKMMNADVYKIDIIKTGGYQVDGRL